MNGQRLIITAQLAFDFPVANFELKLKMVSMIALKAFLGGKLFYLLLIGFAAAITVVTITTVAVVGKPEVPIGVLKFLIEIH